jgi:hypothetical protein
LVEERDSDEPGMGPVLPGSSREGLDVSFQSVLMTMLRRWYVVVVAMLCAGCLGIYWMKDAGCYSTATTVSFTLPKRPALLPESGRNDENVIAFAGAVAMEINHGRKPASYASNDAPLYGVGVRQGVLVAMPNLGGQWSAMYSRADIEVQIVGRSREWVETTQQEIIKKVFEVSKNRQSSAYTSPQSYITANIIPLTTGVQHVSVGRAAQMLAFAALFFAALLVGGTAAVILDRKVGHPRAASDLPGGPDGPSNSRRTRA